MKFARFSAKAIFSVSICLGLVLLLLAGLAAPVLSHDDTQPPPKKHSTSLTAHSPLAALNAGAGHSIQADDDPLYTQPIIKLTAPGGGDGDWFGRVVDTSGDILVVASPYDDEIAQDSGAAYVFARNQGGADNWGLVKKITAGDGAAEDRFSYNAVAIDEAANTLVIGAGYDDEGGSNGGAAFVFERNAGGLDNWGQVKKIVSPVTGNGRVFGYSLDLSGDTLVVGERGYSNDSGRIYIFRRNQGGAGNWGLVQARTAPSPAPDDQYGFSVAISDDTLAVGKVRPWTPGTDHGTVYLYERNQGGADNWGLVQTLVAADGQDGDRFGWALDLSGDTLAVGAFSDDDDGESSGSAYLFERNQDGADAWGQVQKLTAADAQQGDVFGYDLDLDGEVLVVGAYGDDDHGNASGAAYVFTRNRDGADAWGQVQKVTAFDAAAKERFGQGVALAGDTIIAGAYLADVGGLAAGAVYVLERYGDAWPQQAKPTADDGADNDEFGWSVSISDDTLVVGAHYANVGANGNQGAAYVFQRNQDGDDAWGQVQKLVASDGQAGDQFGSSVSISGDTLVVGAHWADPGGVGDQGAAYVFERNQDGADTWGQVQKLVASDGDTEHEFGWSVAIDGDQIVVGARYADHESNDAQGAAYVFERNQGGADNWGQVQKLVADDGATWDFLGWSVAIDGDSVIAGATGADVDASLESGAAYVFGRNQGGVDNWGQVQKLAASDGAEFLDFGVSVGISGDTAVVGARGAAGGGAAYVFGRNQDGVDNWGQVQKLIADDRSDGDAFGHSVAISGGRVAVGARGVDLVPRSSEGTVYLFEQNRDGADQWGQVAKILSDDQEAGAFLGTSVSLDDTMLAAGAHQANAAGNDRGAAYVYRLVYLAPDLSIDKGVDPLTPIAPGQPLTYTLTFANQGSGLATGIVLTDHLPLSITVQSIISSGVAITDTGSSPPYVWNVAELLPGQGGAITITAVLSSGLPGGYSFDNVATLAETKPEWLTANDSDAALVIVADVPALAVVKTASVATAEVGETITYTYRLTNGGNVTLSGLVAVDDRLGAVPLGALSLAPGLGTSGKLTYTVAEADLPGPLTNTVVVSGSPPAGAVVTAVADASVELEATGVHWIYLPLIIQRDN